MTHHNSSKDPISNWYNFELGKLLEKGAIKIKKRQKCTASICSIFDTISNWYSNELVSLSLSQSDGTQQKEKKGQR